MRRCEYIRGVMLLYEAIVGCLLEQGEQVVLTKHRTVVLDNRLADDMRPLGNVVTEYPEAHRFGIQADAAPAKEGIEKGKSRPELPGENLVKLPESHRVKLPFSPEVTW